MFQKFHKFLIGCQIKGLWYRFVVDDEIGVSGPFGSRGEIPHLGFFGFLVSLQAIMGPFFVSFYMKGVFC